MIPIKSPRSQIKTYKLESVGNGTWSYFFESITSKSDGQPFRTVIFNPKVLMPFLDGRRSTKNHFYKYIR